MKLQDDAVLKVDMVEVDESGELKSSFQRTS